VSPSVWRQPIRMVDAVSETLKRLNLEGRVRQGEVWRVWPGVVGAQIALHAQPHGIWQGRLVVHVTDSVWLHHLSMMRHRLLTALNEVLGGPPLHELILRVGELPTLPAQPAGQPAADATLPPLHPALLDKIETLLAPLQDAPFREALRRLLVRAAHAKPSDADSPR